MDHLPRQTGNTIERKIARNATTLVPPRAVNLAFLATQVTRVLYRRLDARKVDRPAPRIDVEKDAPVGQHGLEPDLGLPQQLACRHSIPRTRPDHRLVQSSQILRKANLAGLEFLPALLVNKAHFVATRRQTQVGVIDAQQQAIFRA